MFSSVRHGEVQAGKCVQASRVGSQGVGSVRCPESWAASKEGRPTGRLARAAQLPHSNLAV